MCKDCSDDNKYEVSSYAFDLATNSFNNKPVLVLKEKDIEKKLGKTISRFKPSAANIILLQAMFTLFRQLISY